MTAAVVALVVCGVASACGSSSDTVTVSGIERATEAAQTVRVAGRATDRLQFGSAQIVGEADFGKSLWQYDLTYAHQHETSTAVLISGTKVWVSGTEGGKSYGPCLIDGRSGMTGFRPDDALKAFTSQGWTISRVGTETVRGVETTHYRLTDRTDPPGDIWVDKQGRLRRVRYRQDSEVVAVDFYDYGANLGSIPIPPPTRCGSGKSAGST